MIAGFVMIVAGAGILRSARGAGEVDRDVALLAFGGGIYLVAHG